MPYEIVPIYDLVTFMMVTDNATTMRPKLDGVRAKRTKFICLNDDMKDPSPAMERVLRDLYQSMFPLPSRSVIESSIYLRERVGPLSLHTQGASQAASVEQRSAAHSCVPTPSTLTVNDRSFPCAYSHYSHCE